MALFLVRRELSLQLIGNRLGDLALDGEDIGQIAIVGLCPEMRVGAGIDQLRVHPHLVGGRAARLPSTTCATPSC